MKCEHVLIVFFIAPCTQEITHHRYQLICKESLSLFSVDVPPFPLQNRHNQVENRFSHSHFTEMSIINSITVFLALSYDKLLIGVRR